MKHYQNTNEEATAQESNSERGYSAADQAGSCSSQKSSKKIKNYCKNPRRIAIAIVSCVKLWADLRKGVTLHIYRILQFKRIWLCTSSSYDHQNHHEYSYTTLLHPQGILGATNFQYRLGNHTCQLRPKIAILCLAFIQHQNSSPRPSVWPWHESLHTV